MKLAVILIPVILATGIFLSAKFGSAGVVSPQAIDIQERIAYHAKENGLPFSLVKAIAKVESNFNPLAKNPADPSYGLMQITPMLAQDYGLVNDYLSVTSAEIGKMYNINNNLNVACRFLKHLNQYPFSQMVQSYNVGEWGYKKGRRNRDYLEKVRGFYNEYN